MKNIISLIFALLTVSFAYSQEVKPLDFTEVVEAEGVSKDDLYLRAKSFFVNAFNDAKEVIQMDDKENGVIIGKGILKNGYNGFKTVVNFTITLGLKDGRYKYDISDINLKTYDSQMNHSDYGLINTSDEPIPYPFKWFKKKQQNIYIGAKTQTVASFDKIIADLKQSMQSPTVMQEKADDNW